jgi:hypothetical protein
MASFDFHHTLWITTKNLGLHTAFQGKAYAPFVRNIPTTTALSLTLASANAPNQPPS